MLRGSVEPVVQANSRDVPVLIEVRIVTRSRAPGAGYDSDIQRVLAEIEEKIFSLDREIVGNDLLHASADRKAHLDLALIARELQVAGRTEHVDMLFSFAIG